MDNNRWKSTLLFILIVFNLASVSISYSQKVKFLTSQLEKIQSNYEAINIPNMNEDEQNSFNNLNTKFNEAIKSRDVKTSQSILDEVLQLQDSVNKRIYKEKLEKEKIEAEKKNGKIPFFF